MCIRDRYLYSETSGRLQLAGFGASVETALQAELAQGALDLPPCTSLDEWHAFRAGVNQLMYTRYGVTVDDCVPVDLGEQIDFADILKARARRAQEAAPSIPDVVHVLDESPSAATAAPPPAELPSPSAAQRDAQALRRLFLELPAVSRELRLLQLPEGLPRSSSATRPCCCVLTWPV